MKDMQAHLERLRDEAEECELISKLATNATKKALFAKLAERHRVLVKEEAIAASSMSASD
jgi:predicted transcriptional regulator